MTSAGVLRVALLVSCVTAACAMVQPPIAAAVFPGSNGSIAVATEGYEGACGDCDPSITAWLLPPAAKASRLPAHTVSFSPSGTRLAYEDDDWRGVWVARADGSHARLLDPSGVGPVWSPAGGLLAYLRRGNVLAVESPRGDLQRRLGRAREFAWSPDGHQLAFTTRRSVRIIGLRGQDERTVVSVDEPFNVGWSSAGLVSYLRGTDLYVVPPFARQPQLMASGYGGYAWAPDGEKLALYRSDGIWVMRAVPGDVPRLLVPLRYGSASLLVPVWSPDSRLVAFVRETGAGFDVLTVPVRGGKPRRFGHFRRSFSESEDVVDMDWQRRPAP